jgi:iron complex outermembrane receptor protein
LFPTWNVDRVEVIKGPSAIFHGQARPGGVINYITNRPSTVPSTTVRLMAGKGEIAHDQVRGEISTTGPINDKLSYRIGVGQWEGGDWHDEWRNSEFYIGGSLHFRPNEKWSILIDLEHIDRDRSDGETLTQSFDINDDGLRTDLPDSFFGGPDRRYTYNIGGKDSFRNYSSNTAETEILFKPTDWLVLRQNINYSEDNFDVLRTFIAPKRDGTSVADVYVGNFANWRDNYSYDTAAIATMQNRYFTNTLQVGIDIESIKNTTPGFGQRNGRRGPVFEYDIATGLFPEYPDRPAEYPLAVDEYVNSFEGETRDGQWNDLRRRIEENTGFYFVNITDLFDEKMKVLWGMRYTETTWQQYYDSQPKEQWMDNYFENDGWVPQIGVNYNIMEGLTAYAVYSESLELNRRIDADGNNGEPVESFGYDIGLKFDLKETGLSGTVNYWLLNRGNQTEADLLRQEREQREPFFIYGLEQETEGIEIDLSYIPVPNWQITLAYSKMFTHEIVASTQNPDRVGEEFAVVPEQLNLWTRYAFTDDVLDGLVLGGGVKWLAARKDRLWVNGESQPSQTTVDLFLKYSFKGGNEKFTHTVGMNVNNLLDDYEVVSNSTAPRMFYVNYTLDF